MKAYLATTGTVFGLIAILHVLRAIDERQSFYTNRGEFLSMAALGLLAAGLSIWAWKLFRHAR